MDLAKRQDILSAVGVADDTGCHVAVRRTDETVVVLRCDLTCFETYIEGTADDGAIVTMPYGDIDEVYPLQKSPALTQPQPLVVDHAPPDGGLDDDPSSQPKPLVGMAKQFIAEIIGDGELAQEGKRDMKGGGVI